MKYLVGFIITYLLLFFYAYATYQGIAVVLCAAHRQCSPDSFSHELAYVLTTVGGLISALIVSELAITPPQKLPLARVFGGMKPGPQTLLALATYTYVAIWLVAGASAFVVGFLIHPHVVEPLTNVGTAWFGIAVAAAYSYFGINPGTQNHVTNK